MSGRDLLLLELPRERGEQLQLELHTELWMMEPQQAALDC